MNKEAVIEKTNKLLEGHCWDVLADAARAWLADDNEETRAAYKEALAGGIVPIDSLIELFSSEGAKERFGEETAAKILAHGKEIKAQGARFCDCPACTVSQEIQKLMAE